jgi:hypothetical protein
MEEWKRECLPLETKLKTLIEKYERINPRTKNPAEIRYLNKQ